MRPYLTILGLVLIPQIAAAGIEITEIAWMGSLENPNDEWIELYNSGDESVSLEGWTITDGGESPLVVLTGSLSAHSYSVLKSTYGDGDVDDVSPNVLTYSRLLSNSGKTLTLKDGGGSTIDQVVGGTNWETIGGNNETKETPQRSGSGWVTASPTPGSGAPAPSGSGTPSPKASSGGGSGKPVQKSVEEKPVPGVLSLQIAGPEIVYVGQGSTFTALPSGVGTTITRSLKYAWNFGDIETGVGREVTHTYTLPGTYVLVLEASYAEHLEVVEKLITVLPVTLQMSRGEKGEISIKNVASHDIRLDGYTLEGVRTIVFPKHSIIKAGSALVLPGSHVEDSPGVVLLSDYHDVVVASLGVVFENKTKAPSVSVPAPLVVYEKTSNTVSTSNNNLARRVAETESGASDEGTSTPSGVGGYGNETLPATIPLYSLEGEEKVTPDPLGTALPYVGLVTLILGGLYVLHRVRSGGEVVKRSPPMPF